MNEQQYVRAANSQYLTLDAVTWTWYLTDRLEDLRVWDYHHDRDCMKAADQHRPDQVDGHRFQYVPVTADQVAIIDQAERDRTAAAQAERRARESPKPVFQEAENRATEEPVRQEPALA